MGGVLTAIFTTVFLAKMTKMTIIDGANGNFRHGKIKNDDEPLPIIEELRLKLQPNVDT